MSFEGADMNLRGCRLMSLVSFLFCGGILEE